MGRKEARESAFQLIYERIVSGEKNATTFELMAEKCADDSAYLSDVYHGVCERLDFLSGVVGRYAEAFSAARIYKVDLSLMVLAAFEILFVSSVPDRVAINEALELVKVYSTEKSSGFVNGILASVVANKEKLIYEFEHPEEVSADGETGEDVVNDENGSIGGDGNDGENH